MQEGEGGRKGMKRNEGHLLYDAKMEVLCSLSEAGQRVGDLAKDMGVGRWQVREWVKELKDMGFALRLAKAETIVGREPRPEDTAVYVVVEPEGWAEVQRVAEWYWQQVNEVAQAA